MGSDTVGRSVAIFFYAGDFCDVLRRHEAGEQQIYATHDEVARLILDYRAAGVEVTIYSYVGNAASDERPMDGVRVVSLGSDGSDRGLLRAAVESVEADTIIAHFAYPELLIAAIRSGKRVFAVLANSYNELGLRQYLRRRRVAFLLNNRRIRGVSNHCTPATTHLASLGVTRSKLVPWDIPHRFAPSDYPPKRLDAKPVYDIAYAGSITELKGVGDLIRAMAALRDAGIQLRASFAGLGHIEGMKALAESLGIGDRVVFHGIIGNDDTFKMFQTADLVTVPSRTAYPEGFPLTLFEAIASRSPIICTDHPMFRSVMRDRINCAVFTSGDVAGYARAIADVLNNADLYGTLSDNAEQTWEALRGPADWRTLMRKWVVEGEDSPWIAEHKLNS